jgi:glycosyltransferase involved in cell wall biosynthesis
MADHPHLKLRESVRRPRVVMCVTNTFTHDTRIDKQARSLAAIGCDVYVLAMAGHGLPAAEFRDGIHIERFKITGNPLLMAAPFLTLLRASRWARSLFTAPTEAPAPATAVSTGTPTPARKKKLLKKWLMRVMPNGLLYAELNVYFARRIFALNADLVECHDANTLFAGMIAKQIAGIPYIYDSHELFLERNIGARWRWIDRLVWQPVEQVGITAASAVFSVAEGICRHLARHYSIRKPFLLRNVQPFESPPARSRLLAEELKIPDGKRIAIYAGGITINRGLERLIESAQYLDNTVIVIMGYAPVPSYGDELLKLADESGVLGRSVFFREAVAMSDVIRYLGSADLGIVPTQNACLSYYYEASNKIFHCLMAGLPLAMSDHIEKREIVERHGVGVLFDERDPKSIADTVNRLLADKAGYDKMRRNCLMAAKMLNWEIEERKLRRVVKKLLRARNGLAKSDIRYFPAENSMNASLPKNGYVLSIA